jgi:LPXTG-motif cell wall-anchored protein
LPSAELPETGSNTTTIAFMVGLLFISGIFLTMRQRLAK